MVWTSGGVGHLTDGRLDIVPWAGCWVADASGRDAKDKLDA
jgi:hypothetical protein